LILFIGLSKRIKYTYGLKKKTTPNEGYFCPTCTAPHPMPSDRPSLASSRRNIYDDTTCTIRVMSPPVLRHKPRNRSGDFEAQITKPQQPVLRSNPGNPPPLILRSNWEKPSPPVLRPNRRKLSPPILRPNRKKSSQ
jgi:hypothetical protein